MKHFLSESAIWITHSEFISPEGKISTAIGESEIRINNNRITNESWAKLDELTRKNFYLINKISDFEYQFESKNPELGTQSGNFNIERNIIYSKFAIENSKLNGFEIIIRTEDRCDTYGALYNGNVLVNTWRAQMIKK